MSGAVLTTLHGGGGSGGTLGPMDWTDIFSIGAGLTNSQTIGGITGTIAMGGSISGAGTLYWVKNLTGPFLFAGPFPVVNGDALIWEVRNLTTSAVSGSVAVEDVTHSVTVDTFNYVVRHDE